MHRPLICPALGGDCDRPKCCAALCRHYLLAPIARLHFVGFKDERYWNAVKAFGLPDFYHRRWDERAQREIALGDVAVFADGSDADAPSPYTWDDSHEDIVARGGDRERG